MDSPNINDIVTMKNIDNEDFDFEYGNVEYRIAEGQTKLLPRFMVDVALTHLIDKILEKQDHSGMLMANKKKRAELADKIILHVDEYVAPRVKTDAEYVEELNKPSDLDLVLASNKTRLQETTKEEAVEKPKEEFQGMKEKTGSPTRQDMLEYARNVLKMDIDNPKTKKEWEKLSDVQLYKELGMEAL